MVINKTKLFESARDRWPPIFTERETVAIYQAIEEACEPTGEYTQSDDWTQLANWAFHQALGALAKDERFKEIIHRDEVTFDLFDEWMRFNLSEECWDEERREYEASPSRFQ
jgi:DNA-binding GntR family transcriptional regulator